MLQKIWFQIWRVVKVLIQNLTPCIFGTFKNWRLENFLCQDLVLNFFYSVSSMKMATIKDECEDCTIYVSSIFDGVWLFLSFFIVVGLKMAVIARPFTLRFQNFKSVWIEKKDYFRKTLF